MSEHSWKEPEFETCELCGDKDWMQPTVCEGKPEKTMQLYSNRTLETMLQHGDIFPCDEATALQKLKAGHDVYFSNVKTDGKEKKRFGYSLAVYST